MLEAVTAHEAVSGSSDRAGSKRAALGGVTAACVLDFYLPRSPFFGLGFVFSRECPSQIIFKSSESDGGECVSLRGLFWEGVFVVL